MQNILDWFLSLSGDYQLAVIGLVLGVGWAIVNHFNNTNKREETDIKAQQFINRLAADSLPRIADMERQITDLRNNQIKSIEENQTLQIKIVEGSKRIDLLNLQLIETTKKSDRLILFYESARKQYNELAEKYNSIVDLLRKTFTENMRLRSILHTHQIEAPESNINNIEAVQTFAPISPMASIYETGVFDVPELDKSPTKPSK